MPSSSCRKGTKNDWNSVDRDSGVGASWCAAPLAAQSGLGLLPDRRARARNSYRCHSPCVGTHLNQAASNHGLEMQRNSGRDHAVKMLGLMFWLLGMGALAVMPVAARAQALTDPDSPGAVASAAVEPEVT